MNSNKIRHFCVHLLALKKLERDVTVRRTFVAVRSHLHVVEVHLAFAHSCSEHYYLLGGDNFGLWDPVDSLVIALRAQVEFLADGAALIILVLQDFRHFGVREQLADLLL